MLRYQSAEAETTAAARVRSKPRDGAASRVGMSSCATPSRPMISIRPGGVPLRIRSASDGLGHVEYSMRFLASLRAIRRNARRRDPPQFETSSFWCWEQNIRHRAARKSAHQTSRVLRNRRMNMPLQEHLGCPLKPHTEPAHSLS